MSKFINPLKKKTHVESVSRDISLTGKSLDVLKSDVCPKCETNTVPVKMADGGDAFFCDNCRVTMPAQL